MKKIAWTYSLTVSTITPTPTSLLIHHFTVACLVAWPLNESEAGVDLVLIQTPLLFFVNDAILMRISSNLHKKSSEVSIKARSPPTSFSFKDQATKPINIEYGLLNFAAQIIDQNCKKEKASTSFLPAFTCDTCIMQ